MPIRFTATIVGALVLGAVVALQPVAGAKKPGVKKRLTDVETRLSGLDPRLAGVETLLSGLEPRVAAIEAETPLAPRQPSELVSLQSNAACASAPGRRLGERVASDGSTSDFAIPTGQVLVITDLSWLAEGALQDPTYVYLTVNGTTVFVEGSTPVSGRLAESAHVGSAVVGSGAELCIWLPNTSSQQIIARGFLASAG